MPIINKNSNRNVNIHFLCSQTVELIASLHVISESQHHTSCSNWYQRVSISLDVDLLDEITSFGKRYNQWSFIMDIADFFATEDDCNDFEKSYKLIRDMNIIDFSYIFLGATLIDSKETVRRLLSNPSCLDKMEEVQKYIKAEDITYFLNNTEIVRNELLTIIEKYNNSFFNLEWEKHRWLYDKHISQEKKVFANSDMINYILGLHNDLSFENNCFLMKKQTNFVVDADVIDEIWIYFSLFTYPHLMVNIYEGKISIYENLIIPEASYSLDQISISAKAFGDPTRLRIVKMLLNNSLTNKSIAEYLQLTPATVSQHIRILKEIGILNAEREKNNIFYSINKNSLEIITSDLLQFLQMR